MMKGGLRSAGSPRDGDRPLAPRKQARSQHAPLTRHPSRLVMHSLCSTLGPRFSLSAARHACRPCDPGQRHSPARSARPPAGLQRPPSSSRRRCSSALIPPPSFTNCDLHCLARDHFHPSRTATAPRRSPAQIPATGDQLAPILRPPSHSPCPLPAAASTRRPPSNPASSFDVPASRRPRDDLYRRPPPRPSRLRAEGSDPRALAVRRSPETHPILAPASTAAPPPPRSTRPPDGVTEKTRRAAAREGARAVRTSSS